VVIVSEGLVNRFWPNQDPIGKRIRIGAANTAAPWLTIVGVVPETKYRALPANPTADPDIFFPAVDRSPHPIIVRTSVPPESVLPAVRAAIREGQPSVAVFATRTMDDLVAQQTSATRFTMWVLGVFAGTALVLSVIGIYGGKLFFIERWCSDHAGSELAWRARMKPKIGIIAASTRLKTATALPMPRVRETSVAAVNTGVRRRALMAYRRSLSIATSDHLLLREPLCFDGVVHRAGSDFPPPGSRFVR
jgi:hypothetical protein